MLSELSRIPFRHARRAVSDVLREIRQMGAGTRLAGVEKLQLGAGPNPLPDWANIDLEGDNIIWDLTRPLPMKERTVRLVYSEHFIEHVTREQGLAILKNCRAVMVDGGTIRLSTPDLGKLARDYLSGTITQAPEAGWLPETPCRMLNEGMRLWGHQFVYDEPEMFLLLAAAGFSDIRRVRRGESEIPELRNLETRPDFGDLIVEATA